MVGFDNPMVSRHMTESQPSVTASQQLLVWRRSRNNHVARTRGQYSRDLIGDLMAQAPLSMSAPSGMMDDPAGGAGAAPDDAGGSEVIVTICKESDGSYTVHPGDEPEGGGGGADMSDDDADAMDSGAPAGGGSGGAPSSSGQPADSIGAALKIAMDIMQADKGSEGAPGNADDQLSAGYGASKSPMALSGRVAQKY